MDSGHRKVVLMKGSSETHLIYRLRFKQDMLWSGLIGSQGILLTAMYQVERNRVLLVDKWFLLSWLQEK